MGFNCLANFSRVINIIDQLIAFSKISFSLVGKKKSPAARDAKTSGGMDNVNNRTGSAT